MSAVLPSFQVHALASGELKDERGYLVQAEILNATECIVRVKNLQKEACVIMTE